MSRDNQILAREAALDRERSAFFADREAERKALAAAEAAFDQRAARFELRLTSLLSRIAAFALSAGAGGGARGGARAQIRRGHAALENANGDPCADEWHTAQCRTPVPHASESTAAHVLDTSSVAKHFKHTHGFPMFATNVAIIISGENANNNNGLHTLRITPLALSCSNVELSTIINSRYRDNSHALLVSGLDQASPRVLLNWSNAEDPRGLVHGDLHVFYTATIQIYHQGKVKPQSLGRMELRRYSWPGLAFQMWANFAWEGNVGVQKNWVPLHIARRHILFSHSLEPHTVLKCELPTPGASARRGDGTMIGERFNRTIQCSGAEPKGICHNGVRYEWAFKAASPEAQCTLAYKTPSPMVWHAAGFHLYQGVSRSNSIRAIPRGGTPCLPLLATSTSAKKRDTASSLVCLGHFRTRLRPTDRRSTYFHFFYAVQPSPPYAITNASRPFRFAKVKDRASVQTLLGPTGVPADEAAEVEREAVQFAVGMVRHGPGMVRVTYGIGDCVSATRDVAISDVTALLSGRLQLDVL